jgi:hypothetical protein
VNLHSAVRGAITSINPDIVAQFQASTGPGTPDASGNVAPTFAAAVPVRVQVQPLSKEDLRHVATLNIQGVFRSIFMFGNPQSVVRPNQQGGDLLTFAQFQGQGPSVWLTIAADGPWNVEQGGWSKILVVLQSP